MRVGRLLVAALHEALAEELPQRLEFYEHWLHSETLRDGTLRLAPLSAVVGFLREEGDAYGAVVARAGTLAADWAVEALPARRRRPIGWLPRRWRVRTAFGVARDITVGLGAGTTFSRRIVGEAVAVQLTESLFCSGRTRQPIPRCGFYLALIQRTLEHCGIAVDGRTESCRAVGDGCCAMAFALAPRAGEGATRIPA